MNTQNPWRKSFVVLSITALILGVGTYQVKGAKVFQNQQTETISQTTTVKDGVFIHVSHGTDNPQRLLMALTMADKMSEDKDVLIYFDIKGVEAVVNNSQDITFSDFPSSKTLLKKLADKGVKLQVCPTCLKAAGKTPADLMSGATIANKANFFNFTQGRIITLDY
ncbi:DsrE family protein [Phormidium sp. LEGE 05292]|uniref:DsrE family protein n=1 Tax=[Phormidium] sp. LEGE 05292 TaxID=767427 RepID=UPI00187E1E7C|nr:DsrE family protein [Phormidium sp. LEGE 05292]MBE9225053.1 DsrE family protein [Phormidium sp. LEGE 05292]